MSKSLSNQRIRRLGHHLCHSSITTAIRDKDGHHDTLDLGLVWYASFIRLHTDTEILSTESFGKDIDNHGDIQTYI